MTAYNGVASDKPADSELHLSSKTIPHPRPSFIQDHLSLFDNSDLNRPLRINEREREREKGERAGAGAGAGEGEGEKEGCRIHVY